MWPKLTNIETKIQERIKSNSDLTRASKLNAYIRVFSGAVVGQRNGLVLESNTNLKLFKAVGERIGTLYGDLQSSGVLGTDWGEVPIATGVGRALRPSPVVKSFSVKEGKDQISRQATLEVTVFSLEQMNAMQKYLLEPGYSLFIEWGWNTEDGVKNITKRKNKNGEKKSTNEIVEEISNKSLNWNDLNKTRLNSYGEYDSFLGFIVGGSSTAEGENFNITVNLRGAPSLPTYLQSHQGTTRLDPSGSVAESYKVEAPFGAEIFEDPDDADAAKRRFAKMFNDLPSFRQIKQIAALIDSPNLSANQFINFDEVVRKKILEGLSQPIYAFWKNDSTVNITTSEGKNAKPISINKENLFSDKRYIRMDLVMAILNEMGALDRYQIGTQEVTFKIDINNTVIGSFPFQFSTKADKLVIPDSIPDFFTYYLQVKSVKQLEGGPTGGNLELDGEKRIPLKSDDGLTPFRPAKDLNDFGYTEKEGYWGYLKYLFVNFEMFKSKIEQKNKNIREILSDILFEMSGAVNSFWNFQIVEGEFKATSDSEGFETKYANKKDGDIIITVIDENFIGQNKNKNVAEFTHSGTDSIFLESNVEFSIPSEMTNQIIMKRLGNSTNPDETRVSVTDKTFFTKQQDLFITGSGESASETDLNGTGNVIEDNNKKKLETLTNDLAKAEENYNNAVLAFRKNIKEEGTPLIKSDKRKALEKQVETTRNERQKAQNALNTEKGAQQTAKESAAAANLTSNLQKLTVLPKSNSYNINLSSGALLNTKNIQNDTFLKDRFAIYTFDDTEYLDKLRNDGFGKKGATTLSAPLPIKYNFKILGNSGIRRGDTFHINGIPTKYKTRGIFQVTQVEHTLDGMLWTTNVTGEYRQTQ